MNILLNISDQVAENGLKIDWEMDLLSKLNLRMVSLM